MITPRNTYLRVADTIRTAIKDGTYTERLPTVDELTRVHGVGRGVIGRAMGLLTDEGLTESQHGIGWFVAGTGDRRLLDVRIREMLMNDDFYPGDRFPTVEQLCSRFGVCPLTAIKATARLEGERLISHYENRKRYVLAIPTDKERP